MIVSRAWPALYVSWNTEFGAWDRTVIGLVIARSQHEASLKLQAAGYNLSQEKLLDPYHEIAGREGQEIIAI